MVDLEKIGVQAREAARALAGIPTEQKDRTIGILVELLRSQQTSILEANQMDIEQGQADGLTPALIDRLRLTPARLDGIADDLKKITDLDDPVGQVFDQKVLANGLKVHKQRVPLGVLAVIYESRPNVTVDVTGLALKTGNAVILRGGKETLHSNRALLSLIHLALIEGGIPKTVVQFIDSSDRALVMDLLQMHDVVDMLIPRGGAGLHQFCRENSRIPVITGGIGICHLYVAESADQGAALKIIHNAKTQRPSVCNALDTVLVDQAIAKSFIPALIDHMSPAGVKFMMDAEALIRVDEDLIASGVVAPAGPDDFDQEWLSLVLGIKVVKNLNEVVSHIQAHSTGHSDGILTQDNAQAEQFVQVVDSAAVYVNASTRFTDGSQLGLGAEVAISTQRLHARGPMALEALTTYKWVIQGENHVRPD